MRHGRFLLLACLIVVAVAVRLHPREHLIQRDGLLIHDVDTLRRLARLHALDQAASYPITETLDGYPQGSELHWTLPMDWVIRGLDPLVSWMFARARTYEAGAVLAGPLLAALATTALVLLARRLFGAGRALIAGALYALAYSCVNTSLLGNGDHQSLQQLAVAVTIPSLWLALRAAVRSRAAGRAAATRWAIVAGAALGFAVWVSTELMLLFYVCALALAAAAVWPWRRAPQRGVAGAVALPWALAVFALAVLGVGAEQRHDLVALRWDAISTFQLWQVAVFVVFAALLRLLRGPWAAVIAGGAALVLGALPFVFPAVRTSFAAQLENARQVGVWLHAEVSEFRSLFQHGWGTLFARDGYLVLALPCALAFASPARLVVSLTALGTFALYVWEIKVGHLFTAVFPLVLVAAWPRWKSKLARPWRQPAAVVVAAAAILLVVVQLPSPRADLLRHNDIQVRQICATIAGRRAGAQEASVLAPWDMGAPLLYHAGVPVVASGYHRNFAGIRDGYRFFLSDGGDTAAAAEILRRRRVRWVVAWYDRSFFYGGPLTLGRPPLRVGAEFLPAVQTTLFWKLRYDTVPGLRLVAEGPQIQLTRGAPSEPLYRIFEVAN
jgi:hypothetical protein